LEVGSDEDALFAERARQQMKAQMEDGTAIMRVDEVEITTERSSPDRNLEWQATHYPGREKGEI
jgi:hypothetical protein